MSSLFDHSALEDEKRWITLSQKEIHHFRPLYDKYYQSIFRYIFRRMDNEMLTADLCSQTFLKAMTNIKKFQWAGKPLGAWLYRIAGNEVKKYYRDKKEIFIIEEDKLLETDEFREDWKLMTQEKLIKLLDELSETDMRLIELKYFEGFTFHEISILLEINESTVKMRLYRLLGKLRKKLEVDHV
ncbi:MAG: sigma-70 family RNA polymerase sigma factor [Cyclobacteriaceae bacterium]